MSKLIILCTIYLLCYTDIVAQTQKNKYFMDTLYKKELNENITLSFVADDSSNQDTAIWHTCIYHKKQKITLPIDRFAYNKHFGDPWQVQKTIGEGAPFLINMVSAFLTNHTLYVIYSTWGVVRVVVYTFTEVDKFTKQTYLIGRFPAIGAYGKLNHFANFKLYDKKLFFYLQAGQQRDNTILFLGYFDTANKQLHQYKFSENPKKIKDTQQIGNQIDEDLSLTSSTTHHLMAESIQQLLVAESKIKQPNDFQYLFTIDGCSNNRTYRYSGGMLYVFYKEEPHYGTIKVMQYFNAYPTPYWLLENATQHIIEPLKIPL